MPESITLREVPPLPLPDRLIIPNDLEEEIVSSTTEILSTLLTKDSNGKFSRKPEAPHIVAIPNRSGPMAAAGVIDFFKRHNIDDPRLVILDGLGTERNLDCGDPIDPDYPDASMQLDVEEFTTRFRHLAHDPSHPLNSDLHTLTNAIETIQEDIEGIRIGVIDDVISTGQTTGVMMPELVKLAAEAASLSADTTPSTVNDLIKQYYSNEPHTNPNTPRSIPAGTVSYEPEKDVWVIFKNPNSRNWQSQITSASFPSPQFTPQAIKFPCEI